MQWLLFVYCLLPIGFISLVLVSLPIPSKVGKHLNSKLLLLGSLRVPYMKINIIHFLISISLITFTLTTCTVYTHSKTQESNWNGIGLNPTCIRWRVERNFWICTTNVIIYWATYVIYNIKNTLYNERITREKEYITIAPSFLTKKTMVSILKNVDDALFSESCLDTPLSIEAKKNK